MSVLIRKGEELEENIGIKISDISLRNIFFSDISLHARGKKKKNEQMRLYQTKKFLHFNKMKRQTSVCEDVEKREP